MLTTIVVAVALVYMAFSAVLFFSQDSMLFLPNIPGRELTATPKHIGLNYEPVKITTADGETLDSWFIPAQQARGALLFFHGNAGNISHRLDSIRIFNDLALNVLIVDYRGYGQSTGKPSEQGVYRDAEAAWEYLVQKRAILPQHVILFGRSLGGSVATWLAARKQPGALIVESTFTSAPDIGAKLYPWLPVRLLARLDFNTKHNLSSVQSPLLVIHSRDDEIIPFAHGQANFTAANPPKDFLELRGGHNDGFLASEKVYIEGLDAFISEHIS